MKCYLDRSDFPEERSLSFPFYCFPLLLCIVHWRRPSYFSLLFSGSLHSVGYIFHFLPCFLLLFFPQLFINPPQTTTLPSCISFSLSESEVAQLYPTLCDPTDCSLPGSSVHGIFQARILEWVAVSFSRGSTQPKDWTRVSRIGGRRFNLWATREAQRGRYTQLNAEFQRIARKDKKAFFNEQCKEIEENNIKGKTSDLFKKTGDFEEHFIQGWVWWRTESMDLAEAEEIKKRWQEYRRTIQKRS